MESLTKEQLEARGAEYWENELSYLENAMDGLRTSYAILDSMHKHAQEEYKKCLPDRENID